MKFVKAGRIVLLSATVLLIGETQRARACFCNCYFDRDCPGVDPDPANQGDLCNVNFNIGGRCSSAAELLFGCLCMKPKPTGPNQAGKCNSRDQGGSSNCDGVCQSPNAGSSFASYAPFSLSESIQLWGDAIIDIAESGGGLVDEQLAQQAMDALGDSDHGDVLGRHVGSLLVSMAGDDFIYHPEGVHMFAGHTVGDLSGNSCLVEALRRIVDAQRNEIASPGTGAAIMETIPTICPDVFNRADPCAIAGGTVHCLKRNMRSLSTYLTTVREEQGSGEECVPTVSEWGLIAMVMVGLTAGTIMFGRRRLATT